jgi:D-alanine-D-alanine ligase
LTTTNIILLAGGEGSEHDISLISANYIINILKQSPKFNVKQVTIFKDHWEFEGLPCTLNQNKTLSCSNENYRVDYVIPCIHGYPGETGDIQSLLELYNIPYLGCDSWCSKMCFNKVLTKILMEYNNIPNTPFTYIGHKSEENYQKAADFLNKHSKIFVKAASQGSSVGCYKVEDESELKYYIDKAFEYSDSVLIEQAVKPRELEVAVYEYKGNIIITTPGEVITPSNQFYTFEEKYNSTSQSTTIIEANISDEIKQKIKEIALKAYKLFKIKDLSRIDFFLVNEHEILLNEINTFPGMTPSSMFPKMLENHGEKMLSFFEDRIMNAIK